MDSEESEARLSVARIGLSRGEVVFLILLIVFVFLQLFRLPFVPFYFEGDQLLPVTNAMRLLEGEVMYRDFFHFAPPGTELFYAVLFSVFGVKAWILNAAIFLLACAQVFLIFAFSKRVLSVPWRFLPALIYFVLGFRLFGIDGSYRLFSVVFALTAIWIISKKRSANYLIFAGVLCGLSSFFVQTRGILAAGSIGLFILWVYWSEGFDFRKLFREWLIVAASFLVTILVTQFYFAWLAGFDNYYFSMVTFLKDYYGSDTLSNSFAYFSDVPDLNSYTSTYGTVFGLFRFIRVAGPTLFFYLLVPVVYLVYFLYRKFRTVDPAMDRILMLLSICGTVLYVGASAPTAFRLYHISIPAVVVGVWLLSQVTGRIVVARVLTAGLITITLSYCIQRQTVEYLKVDLPAGTVGFLNPASAEKYSWLAAELKPGEYVYEAQHPTFYFPLHLKNPTPFYLVRDNNYTPTFQVQRLIDSLERNPPRLIVWQGSWSKSAADRKAGDNLAPLWDLIQNNYNLKKEFLETGEFTVNSERDIEFWELKQAQKIAVNP